MKKTKIIATHGPALNGKEDLISLYERGVNIIRFNFSHAKYDAVKKVLEDIRALNESGKTQLSTLLDTKGPEIRTGDLSEKQYYEKNQVFKIFTEIEKFREDGTSLFCDYSFLKEDAFPGQMIQIDSGLFQVEVRSVEADYLEVQALNDAVIGSRRHVNLPGVSLKLPGITGKDKEDIQFAIDEKMDFIALSFVREADNVLELRKILETQNADFIKIISKIENQEGIENVSGIIEVSDGIMVARGDLWIEVPIEKLPTLQAQIVEETLQKGKFTIIATHLLESMIENPFPTRAEVSDIYNSVLQRSDAVMLSGETASGKFPLRSVEVMTATIHEAESHIRPLHRDFSAEGLTLRDIEKKSLIKSAIYSAEELGVNGLFIFTKSGKLARLAASFRPNLPIYAFTMKKHSLFSMNILFWVQAFLLEDWDPEFTLNVSSAVHICKKQGILKTGDKVIVVNDIKNGEKEIPLMELLYID